jgi:hypothetical protein
MAAAKQRAAWAHTSSILALLANVNRDPRKHGPFKASDFDPYARKATASRKAAEPIKTVTMAELGVMLGYTQAPPPESGATDNGQH